MAMAAAGMLMNVHEPYSHKPRQNRNFFVFIVNRRNG